jgi:hypothetical protein
VYDVPVAIVMEILADELPAVAHLGRKTVEVDHVVGPGALLCVRCGRVPVGEEALG